MRTGRLDALIKKITVHEATKAAAAEDESVRSLMACYTSGFYGDCSDAVTLVSIAPSEEEILTNLCDVPEKVREGPNHKAREPHMRRPGTFISQSNSQSSSRGCGARRS